MVVYLICVRYLSARKFPEDRYQVIRLALVIERRVEAQFGDKGPTLKWLRGFRDRHNDLSLHKVEAIDRGRATNAKDYVIQNKLLDMRIVPKPRPIC